MMKRGMFGQMSFLVLFCALSLHFARTPLHAAVGHLNFDAVKVLVEVGIDTLVIV